MQSVDRITSIINADTVRIQVLECVFQLNLPQCYLAAGFVRNAVWDHLHQKPLATPLNDVDVIYFDPTEHNEEAYLEYEATLNAMLPALNWQVRNQANMHIRNGDKPYLSALDAMSYWPEKETAIGIRKVMSDSIQYECVSPFGFESLLNLHVTHNPKRDRTIFDQRIKSKGWLKQWPALKIRYT